MSRWTLDERVARHVVGMDVERRGRPGVGAYWLLCWANGSRCGAERTSAREAWTDVPPFSADWEYARFVIRHMRSEGWGFRLHRPVKGEWTARFRRISTEYTEAESTAPSPEVAVCEAALDALGLP